MAKRRHGDVQAQLRAIEDQEKAEVAALKARRKKQKDALKQRLREIESQNKRQERKNDTRRKILLGALELDKIGRNDEAYAAKVRELDGYLERDRDRALFGLEPLPTPEDS